MFEKPFVSAIVLALLALPAAGAQDWEAISVEVPRQAVAAATPNCSGGIVYDDGGFEAGYSVGPGEAGSVMRFDLPAGTSGLEQVCTCFSRDAAAPANIGFEVVVYDNNGPGNGPGTFLGSVGATANAVPVFPNAQFYNVNLAGSGISLPDQSVFVGVTWPGGSPPVYICGDTSGSTAQRTSFGSGNGGSSWTSYSTLFPTNPPRALGVRVDPLTGTGCTPGATAMCLNGNRFKVEATFRTSTTPAAPAQAVKLTDDTGYFWFFNSANVEVLVKVLNACSIPTQPRYWVFASGLTNVEVLITVTDTERPGVPPKTYLNPLNRPFPPVQDTSAFATCP